MLYFVQSDKILVIHFGFGRDVYSIPPSNITIIRKVRKDIRSTLIGALTDLDVLHGSNMLLLQYHGHETFYPRILFTDFHRPNVQNVDLRTNGHNGSMSPRLCSHHYLAMYTNSLHLDCTTWTDWRPLCQYLPCDLDWKFDQRYPRPRCYPLTDSTSP